MVAGVCKKSGFAASYHKRASGAGETAEVSPQFVVVLHIFTLVRVCVRYYAASKTIVFKPKLQLCYLFYAIFHTHKGTQRESQCKILLKMDMKSLCF